MLLDVTVLPIRLLFTSDGAVALLIRMPRKTDEAGAAPVLLILKPPTRLLFTVPPLLLWLMPAIADVFAEDTVEVRITIDPLVSPEPIVFPSALVVPPTVIPEPLVSIPVKIIAFGDAGLPDTVIAEMVFPLM